MAAKASHDLEGDQDSEDENKNGKDVKMESEVNFLVIEADGPLLSNQVNKILEALSEISSSANSQNLNWTLVNLVPSVASKFLSLCKDKVRPLALSNRTILITPKAVITKSKRGN